MSTEKEEDTSGIRRSQRAPTLMWSVWTARLLDWLSTAGFVPGHAGGRRRIVISCGRRSTMATGFRGVAALRAALAVLVLALAVPAQEGRPNPHPTLAIGSPAPDFSLPGIDGKTHTLSDYKDPHPGHRVHLQPLPDRAALRRPHQEAGGGLRGQRRGIRGHRSQRSEGRRCSRNWAIPTSATAWTR